jgi:hypothetical protein
MQSINKDHFCRQITTATLQKSYPMSTSISQYFYLFKGDWYDLFIDLIEFVTPQQKFTIWEPRNRAKDHNLVVVTGAALPLSYCLQKNIWTTNEQVFEDFYNQKPDQFNIHSNYNGAPEENPTDTENMVKTN